MAIEDVASEKKATKQCGNTAMIKFLSLMQAAVCTSDCLLNRQCFVHICIRKISCATLQCSASVQHNMELNTLRNLELYWSL